MKYIFQESFTIILKMIGEINDSTPLLLSHKQGHWSKLHKYIYFRLLSLEHGAVAGDMSVDEPALLHQLRQVVPQHAQH